MRPVFRFQIGKLLHHDNIICLTGELGDALLTQSETLTERVVLMVSWNDIFTFVIMLMAILTYIDNHRHKK
ncbi:hypothetical protein C810_03442 [Lachnospiraceae bacterium A2]|nr:hypothetical protein C810_03442 [Lachnospiraceae bacterium A2]